MWRFKTNKIVHILTIVAYATLQKISEFNVTYGQFDL